MTGRVYHDHCDCCGKKLSGPRYRISEMYEYKRNQFTFRGVSHYYCASCMQDVQRVICEHEKWAKVEKRALGKVES